MKSIFFITAVSSFLFSSVCFAEKFDRSSGLPVQRVNPTGFPTEESIDYNARNSNAGSEFMIDSFARGEFARQGSYRRWLKADVVVDARSLQEQNKILNVGMYVSYTGTNENTPSGRGLYLGNQESSASNRYLLDFPYEENVPGASADHIRQIRTVDELAFFIDIERKDGSIDRRWVNNAGRNFRVEEIFNGHPIDHVSGGNGGLEYVGSSSPIFNQKRACNWATRSLPDNRDRSTGLPIFELFDSGNWFERSIDYIPRNHSANNSEFFINSFGLAHFSTGFAHREWITAEVLVDPRLVKQQHNKILNVGMYVSYSGAENASSGRGLFLAEKDPNSQRYTLDFIYAQANCGGVCQYTKESRQVDSLAFFIDVQRVDGSVDRLWVNHAGRNFTLNDICGDHGRYFVSRGIGGIDYVGSSSPIFNQKRASDWTSTQYTDKCLRPFIK